MADYINIEELTNSPGSPLSNRSALPDNVKASLEARRTFDQAAVNQVRKTTPFVDYNKGANHFFKCKICSSEEEDVNDKKGC